MRHAFELVERDGHGRRKLAEGDSLEEIGAFLEAKTGDADLEGEGRDFFDPDEVTP